MLQLRLPRSLGIATAITLTAVTVAACGGSGKPSGSTGTTVPSSATLMADGYKYSACMRNHGITAFPDPQFSHGGQSMSIHITANMDVGSPAFNTARKACAHLMPGGGKQISNGPSAAQTQAQTAAYVAFAACMRKHGFPHFPDPNGQGQLSLSAIQAAGINFNEPALKPAADGCTSVTHGLITKADVAQAIANPNGGSGGQAQAGG